MTYNLPQHALSRRQRFAKRTFDLGLALVGLLLGWWVILLAYVAATIDTRRQGFFTQRRVGRHGRLFRVIKIRTMRDVPGVDTDVTTDRDPRITRLGRFFRRTKIDELPQLLNILLGQMSFVGPRPDVPGFADTLKGEDRIVLGVRPGITGPATLKYRDEERLLSSQADPQRYNREVIYPDKVRINRQYVRDYRFADDLRYLWQTLLGRGLSGRLKCLHDRVPLASRRVPLASRRVPLASRQCIGKMPASRQCTGKMPVAPDSRAGHTPSRRVPLACRRVPLACRQCIGKMPASRRVPLASRQCTGKMPVAPDSRAGHTPSRSVAVDNPPSASTGPISSWPRFDEDEIAAVVAVLRSGKVNYWTGGEGRAFEREFAAAVGCEHAVALANGTLALEAALRALGIGPGDEVVVPSRTFIASASCCVMCGAVPVFADVDPVSQNLTAETVRAVLTPRTKAVIAVHLAGWPCEMDPLMALAREHGLKVIEDCAQAHGATYRGRSVGSIGHAGAFSFCQDKILSTGGEGGMLTTNDEEVRHRAWSLKDHGKSWEAVQRPSDGQIFRWLHESFGTNWRMTEMQAAIGRVILPKLPERLAIRRRHAALLTERFRASPALRVTIPPEHVGHAYYKYYVFLRRECLRRGWSRDRIVRELQAEGIPCGSGSCSEVYLEKAFEDTSLRPPGRLPVARELGRNSLMFLVDPTRSEDDLWRTCRAVEGVLHQSTTAATPGTRRAA